MPPILPLARETGRNLDLARILLIHGDLPSRLALQTILQAGGYSVDVAASPAEAMFKLDDGRYELVLTDQRFSSDILAYARVKDYRPATAVVNASAGDAASPFRNPEPRMSVHTEDVPTLLEDVAELIAARARRRYRPLRPVV